MRWVKVTDKLPDVEADGYSEPVLVYFGKRFLPEIAQYSPDNTTMIRGTRNKRGAQTHWFSTVWTDDRSGRDGPTLHPTHWCRITFPDYPEKKKNNPHP